MLQDNQRLVAALERHGATVQSHWFEREMHAFHGFIFTPNALRCWRETFDFLSQHV